MLSGIISFKLQISLVYSSLPHGDRPWQMVVLPQIYGLTFQFSYPI